MIGTKRKKTIIIVNISGLKWEETNKISTPAKPPNGLSMTQHQHDNVYFGVSMITESVENIKTIMLRSVDIMNMVNTDIFQTF